MTEHEQHIAEIEVYGFALVDDVLSADEVGEMKEALIRCEREHGTEHTHRGAASHVANLPTMDPVFFKTIDHARILPLLEHFLEKSLILGSLNSRIVRPGDGEQQLHSDIPKYMLNMDTPVMMNTVWLLSDFSAANGGTRVVPGSQKSGLVQPPEGMEVKHEVQPQAPAGSVIVFNGQTWHAGGANNSDADRYALFGHYRKHMLLFQCDPHDGFPAEWHERLTPRQRELLRMKHGVGVEHAADAHMR